MIDIFRLDDDCWLILANDSRDDVMLLHIDVPVDSPILFPQCSESEMEAKSTLKDSLGLGFHANIANNSLS